MRINLLPCRARRRGAGDAGAARVPSPSDWGNPARRLTDVILALNMLCFVGQHATGHLLTAMGAKVNSLVMAGQWWRLLTPAFLHSGLLHLVVNCHALNTIGPEVERTSGRGRFAAVYVASTLVGTALSVALTPAPSIGASAAIFGLGAAAAVYYYRHRSLLGPTSKRMLQSLGWSLAINAVYSAANRRIDNWGHLGGMLGGAAVAWLLGPTFVPLTGSAGLLADRPLVPLLASKGSFALKK